MTILTEQDFERYAFFEKYTSAGYSPEQIAANKKALEDKVSFKQTDKEFMQRELIKELVNVIFRIKEWDIEGFALAIPLDIRKDMQTVIEKAIGVINEN